MNKGRGEEKRKYKRRAEGEGRKGPLVGRRKKKICGEVWSRRGR